MKRLHIHVAVDNLDNSIRFYSGMFGAKPTVAKTDYAKWMLEDPRVNFAISRRGAKAGLNHLGMQVESAGELSAMQARLASLQPDVKKEEDVACCYAKGDKYWVTDPSGIAWETFHTLDSIPVFGKADKTGPAIAVASCCAPVAKPEAGPGADGP
jgi:catechol 2,3-dioxygenase-like lactoylglutathione lyase family enzyme